MKRKIIFSIIFSSLISACAFIAIPLPMTQVPIVLQNMLVVMSGQLLGPFYGMLSVLIFLIAGALGLPIFSGGTGGIYRFISPTGGFLFGYLFSSFFSGIFFLNNKKPAQKTFAYFILSSFVGFVVMYIPGIFHFMIFQNKGFIETVYLVLIPFLIPDTIKMVLCSYISFKSKPTIQIIIDKYSS